MINGSSKPYVIANWKMQGSLKHVHALVEAFATLKTCSDLNVIICPPLVYLQALEALLRAEGTLKPIALGAQTVCCEKEGAYTGEVSAGMLKEVGCQYVLVGHSERRKLFGEGLDLVARKFCAAYDAGLVPILCVGETAEERLQGKTRSVVYEQLSAVLEAVGIEALCQGMIAYEPVWAIGTGVIPGFQQVQEVLQAIKTWVRDQKARDFGSARLLYGGSVNAENVQSLLQLPELDGVLVGGASLNSADFLKICQSAKERI